MKAFSCSFPNFIAGCSAAAAAVAAVSILNSPVKPERSADPGPTRNAPDRRIGSRGSGQARGAAIHSSAQVARVQMSEHERFAPDLRRIMGDVDDLEVDVAALHDKIGLAQFGRSKPLTE